MNTETEIIFLLDRSGSMDICIKNFIEGYNFFLDSQKQNDSKAYITTVLFDNHYEILHDHVEIQEIKHISEKEYFARGTTALFDAIGIAVSNVMQRQIQREKNDNLKTIIIIMTDGLDNASSKYHVKDIRQIIQEQQEKYRWEFIFLGAEIDIARAVQIIGISPDRYADFEKDINGLRHKFKNISKTVTNFRLSGKIDDNWKK